MNVRATWLTIGLWWLLCAGTAWAQEASFEALGQAPVQGGDRVKARSRAIDEALRQAVEQAAGTLFDPDALAARTSELKLRIYPKAKSYVLTYRILDESELPNGSYQVHVAAQVSTGRLFHELGRTGGPTVPSAPARTWALICVEVRPAPTPPEGERADATDRLAAQMNALLRQLLSAHGLESEGAAPDCSQPVRSAATLGGPPSGLVNLVAEVAPAGAVRGADAVGAHVRASLRLREVDGRLLAMSEREADGYGSDLLAAASTALASAFEETSRELAPTLTAKWPPGGSRGVLEVRLSSLPNYAAYATVVRTLQSVPGVGGVEPRRFARDGVELQVKTGTRAAELVVSLSRLLPASAGWRIRPTGEGSLSVEMDKSSGVLPERG